jgi:hypothetical protein
VKIYLLTAGVEVLCINRERARGVLPLKVIKQIKDRIRLSILLQRFFKVVFKVSSGELPWRGLSSPVLTIFRWPNHHSYVH